MRWTWRREIELEPGTVPTDDTPGKWGPTTNLDASIGAQALGSPPQPVESSSFLANYLKSESVSLGSIWTGLASPITLSRSEKKVITHKGVDIFEVLWST